MFAAAAITVLLEGAFLFAFGGKIKGIRTPLGVVYAALVNVFTNVSLNLTLYLIYRYAGRPALMSLWIYPAELLIVAVETALYIPVFGASKRLLLLTLCANALSYASGILINGHI